MSKHECYKCGKKQHLKQCPHCEQWYCPDHIEFEADPYQSDIYGDETKVWECADCRYESAMDI